MQYISNLEKLKKEKEFEQELRAIIVKITCANTWDSYLAVKEAQYWRRYATFFKVISEYQKFCDNDRESYFDDNMENKYKATTNNQDFLVLSKKISEHTSLLEKTINEVKRFFQEIEQFFKIIFFGLIILGCLSPFLPIVKKMSWLSLSIIAIIGFIGYFKLKAFFKEKFFKRLLDICKKSNKSS